jgi:hypothetical protein
MDTDNNNINTVSVKSVDEERRKFRVIWANAARFAGNEQKGTYKFTLPPPTALANSHKYPNAIIKIDSFTAHTLSGVNDAVWYDLSAGAALKLPAIEIRLNIGSSQTVNNHSQNAVGLANGGYLSVSGFKQMLPLQIVNVGNNGAPVPAADSYAWTAIGSGVAATDAIICANPFGQEITLTLNTPYDEKRCYLRSAAGANVDAGIYSAQISIELIENN